MPSPAAFPSAPVEPIDSPRVLETAEKLERHIRASGLKRGDRYLTAEHAANLVGVSMMTVQRAMSVLARRNVLDRRRKAGTFIGAAASPVATDFFCLHYFLPEHMVDKQQEEIAWDQIHGQILGLRRALPNLLVQFDFVPNQNLEYVQDIVSRFDISGAIVALSSRAMRVFFDRSGIPTVVAGSSEPDLMNLCWVDFDQSQMGHLLASHLLQRGHRQIATVMRSIWGHGDHVLHDGINEALAGAGLSPTAVQTRSGPPERSAIESLAHELLTTKSSMPTGFICRTEFQAECVSRVARELGKTGQVEVVLCGPPCRENNAKYSHVEPTIGMAEHGEIIGMMLKSRSQGGQPPLDRGRKISVQLRATNAPSPFAPNP